MELCLSPQCPLLDSMGVPQLGSREQAQPRHREGPCQARLLTSSPGEERALLKAPQSILPGSGGLYENRHCPFKEGVGGCSASWGLAETKRTTFA